MSGRTLAASLALVTAVVTPAAAEPADTLAELSAALATCARVPTAPEWVGAELTVRFSLKRDGALLGRLLITYAKLPPQAADGRAFVGAALASLQGCFPVPVTPGLGGAIAGRLLTVRFGIARPGQVRVLPTI